MGNITKLYAAYTAGFLGKDILDTYFSFIANILLDENKYVADDKEIGDLFKEKYQFALPAPFIRQLLSVGVRNGSFVEDHGRYSVDIGKLSGYRFNQSDFEKQWKDLLARFSEYCGDLGIHVSQEELERFILNIIDDSDERIISATPVDEEQGMKPQEYAWYSFVRDCSKIEKKLYDFIVALSASNITMQALFYSGNQTPDYSKLNVYLDSPMVFALLGMDVEERTKSYKKLVGDIQKAGGTVQVLDNNLTEIEGIVSRASGWALSNRYDIRKANNAARFLVRT